MHEVADDLETIRRLTWQKPEGFEGLGLLSHPTIESMVEDPEDLAQKVLALKSVLQSTIAGIEEAEKQDWPELDRSDARAGNLLLRLDPEYDRISVSEIHHLICTYWKKRGAQPGEAIPLGGGFRKYLQRPLYERLSIALLAELDGLSGDGDGVHEEQADEPDPMALWIELAAIVLLPRKGRQALPPTLVQIVSALDGPIREELGGGREPADTLTNGVLRYARQLSDEDRDSALVSFRSNLSLTLHIIGEHAARVELGERALRSADILENNLARAEILVDDLGWGNYMRDRADPQGALIHIDAAERIAKETLEGDPARHAELTMVVAKAIRHRTLIEAEQQHVGRLEELESARDMLSQLDETDVVRREIGQIFHARALVQAVCLDIDRHPVGAEEQSRAAISQALEDVKEAADIFRGLGDQARYTKALSLEYRLHRAVDDVVEAEHVKAQRDRALSQSAWSRPERVSTLNRV